MNTVYTMYHVLHDEPTCGLRRGDVLGILREDDRDRFRIVREFEGMLERVRLVEHIEAAPDAFQPLGDAPHLHELLGIRRPPARKRTTSRRRDVSAGPPKLTLHRGGAE